MKKLTLLFTVFFAAFVINAQTVAINNDGSSADASAILDIKSGDKGILIPRVFLTDVKNPLPITSPVRGLLVYNSNDNVTDGAGQGYYYWNTYWSGSRWVKLVNSVEFSFELYKDSIELSEKWSINGNSGTHAGNFIGTTDDNDLIFKRNNIKAGWLGNSNTAFGNYSLSSSVAGLNAAFGVNSLKSNTSGSSNTAVGASASFSNTSGTDNVAIGNVALYNNKSGNNNVGIGKYSLYDNTGSNNTAIGYHSLYNVLSGSGNTAIGYNAGVTPNLTNATAIGANAYASLSNTLVLGGTGTSSVKVGIGTQFPATDLEIKQTSGTVAGAGIKLIYTGGIQYHWRMAVDADGDLNLYRNGTLSSYFHKTTGAHVVSSDIRMKKDISSIENVLDKVLQLEAKSYHYKDNENDEPLTIGFIAQEVEKTFPELVSTNQEDGMKAIAYENFSVIAIQAIKEQQEQIEELKKEIKNLKSKNNKRRSRN